MIRKIAFYRYDTQKSYEYAHTSNRYDLLGLTLSKQEAITITEDETDCLNVDFENVKRNAESFKRRFSMMSMSEKMQLASETDRIFNRGVPYWRDDDREAAMKFFAEALKVFPINTDVIGLYGDYYEYSDYEQSMKFYELAISLGSTRKKDYFQLANFYKWKGNYDKAERCYAMWELVKARSGSLD